MSRALPVKSDSAIEATYTTLLNDHLRIHKKQQTFLDHFTNFRNDRLQLVSRSDYVNRNGTVIGNSKQSLAMHLAMTSKAHDASVNRGTRDVKLMQSPHNCLEERQFTEPIRFIVENEEHFYVSLHAAPPFCPIAAR